MKVLCAKHRFFWVGLKLGGENVLGTKNFAVFEKKNSKDGYPKKVVTPSGEQGVQGTLK